MSRDIPVQILAEILVDNSGQRLTHALSTGIVSAFSQALGAVPPEMFAPQSPPEQPPEAETQAEASPA